MWNGCEVQVQIQLKKVERAAQADRIYIIINHPHPFTKALTSTAQRKHKHKHKQTQKLRQRKAKMSGVGPISQDWEPVVIRKKAPNAAAKKDEKAVNAARRSGAEIETLKKGPLFPSSFFYPHKSGIKIIDFYHKQMGSNKSTEVDLFNDNS